MSGCSQLKLLYYKSINPLHTESKTSATHTHTATSFSHTSQSQHDDARYRGHAHCHYRACVLSIRLVVSVLVAVICSVVNLTQNCVVVVLFMP